MTTSSGVVAAVEFGPRVAESRMRPYDVRLRREITHRRLAYSLVRRTLRVLALHVLDGVLLAMCAVALANAWGMLTAVRPLLPAIVVTFLLCLNAVLAYKPGDARRDRRRLASAVVLGTLLLGSITAFPPHLPMPLAFIVVLGATAFVALSVGRKVVDAVVRQAYARGIGLRRALLVGSLDEVSAALPKLRDDHNVDQYVVGHLSPDEGSDPTALGTLADLRRVVDEMDVQEVLVLGALPAEVQDRVAAECFERGVSMYVVPTAMGYPQYFAEPVPMPGVPMLRLHPARLEMPALAVKRLVDVVLAALAIVLLSPLLALVALAIKIETAGPVFFRQRRVGLGGRTFTTWKFRHMAIDAEERLPEVSHLNIYGDGHVFKLPADPRITRVGRVLRRTSLDELPQLFNIIRGEMSLVGPRPPVPREVERYAPHHFERLSVVPGLTGPWQVNGRNLVTDFEAVLEMEREYIRRWSLLVDLKIMFRTVGVVIRGEGAY
jgi:exopolysaccharide biosynthesis polyprenyl glycosylphosphotransferase